MKKHLVKVLSIVMALTMVLGVFGPYAVFAQNTAAHDHDDVECDHVWGDVVVDDITCDENGNIVSGKIYRECTVEGCDEIDDLLELTEQNIFDILGVGCQQHGAYEYELVDEPTCTEDGKIVLTCPVCGDGFGTGAYEIPVKKLGHTTNGYIWNSANDARTWTRESDPTCTDTGLDVRECDRCGTPDEKSVPKLDHKLPNGNTAYVKINPADGCGCAADTTKVPENTPIEQVGTCYQKGWIYQHCTLCHDVRKIDNPQSNHPWNTNSSGQIVYKEITGTATCPGTSDACDCTKATLFFKVCSICGIYEEEVSKRQPATGHEWEDREANRNDGTDGWERVTDSTKKTCDPTSVNYWIRECKNCDCTEKVNYFIEPHKMEKYICDTHTDNCTNCLDAGRELVCSVCGEKDKDAVYAEHDLKQGALVKAATCTAPAVYKFECDNDNCTYSENQNVGNPVADNHPAAYGDNGEKGLQIYQHIEPNCKEDGKLKAYCNDCFKSIDKVLPKTPNAHGTNYVTTKAPKTPSCMEGGWTLGGYCTLCGHEDISENLVKDFSPAGHAAAGCTPVEVIKVEATCVHPAFEATLWSKCERDTTTTIGTARDYSKHYSVTVKWVAGTDNTKKAQKTITNITPANVEIVDPTCMENGNHAYSYCPGCDKITSIDYTSCVAKGCTLEDKSNANDHKAAFDKYIGTDRNTNGGKLTITKLGHKFPTNPQVPFLAETCNVPGNQATIYCTRACCQNVEDGADMGANTFVENGKVYLVKDSYTVVNGERVNGKIPQNGATIAPHGFGHIWENITNVKAATCTENGKAAGKFCSLCKPSTAADRCCNGNNDVIPATGHNLKSEPVDLGFATLTIVRCDNPVCNSDLEANPGAIYLKGTSAVKTGTAYTDGHGAHIWYGHEYVATTNSAPVAPNTCEHPEANITTNTSPADCVNAGLTIKTCSCGEVVDVEVLPATGHKNAVGNYIYLDCQSYELYAGQTCDACGLTAGEDIQHDLEYVYEAPDCEKAEDAEEGKEYYVCADCDLVVDVDTYANSTDDFIDADYDPETVAPTVGVIPTTTAMYVSTVEYVPATSTTVGYWTWLCVCGDEHTQVLNYTYSLEFDVEVNPYTKNAEATELTFVNGGLVEVLVSVTAEDVAISALNYKLGYNNQLFTFVSAEIVYDTDAEAEGVQNDFEQPTVGVNATNITILTTAKTGVDTVNITGEQVPFIKYVFKLSEGAIAIAATDITLMIPEFVATADAGVAVINNQLTENVEVALMGDLNGDDVVDIKDFVKFRAISNENGYNVAADFNNNGAVDFLDLIALNNFLVSDKTVADYYTMLGVDIAAEIADYNYRDFNADGKIDLLDAAAFQAAFDAILDLDANYLAILGANNVAALLAAANA